MWENVKLLAKFLGHTTIATAIFVGIGFAAYIVHIFTAWLEANSMPPEIVLICHVAELFVFAIDALCLLFWISVEAWRLCLGMLHTTAQARRVP